MKLDNLILQRYFHELNIKQGVLFRGQIYIAVYISIFSLLGFMMINVNANNSCCRIMLFLFFLIFTVIFIGRSVYYCCKALTGHNYKQLPKCEALCKYIDDFEKSIYTDYHNLKLYNLETGENVSLPNVDVEISRELLSILSENVDNIEQVNITRYAYLKTSLRDIMIGAGVLACAFVVFTVLGLSNPSTTKSNTSLACRDFLIENLEQLFYEDTHMSEEKKTIPPKPTPKPQRPVNVVVTESFDPPKPRAQKDKSNK